jgi:catabolite regulation protein CreA
MILHTGPASALGERVGEFNASGFLFKDSVELTAIDDPEVPGERAHFGRWLPE